LRIIFLELVIALVVSLCLTPVLKRAALAFGFLDKPAQRKLHRVPIPLLGGLAIYIAAVASVLLFVDTTTALQVAGIVAGATLISIVGILDDAGKLHHQFKFRIGIPAASLVLVLSGIHITLFDQAVVNYGMTLLWVVGIVSAFNILDNMDGICAGVASVASLFFVVNAVLNEQYLVMSLASAVMGASIGFLVYNFHPATVFMGDIGALFLGFMMATVGVKLRFLDTPETVSWMIPVLVLIVPIFDTTLVTISRIRRGLIPFSTPGKDHLSHRLANVGLNPRQVALVIYILGSLGGALSLVVPRLNVVAAYIILATVTIVGIVGVYLLEHVPFEDQRTYRSESDLNGATTS
jgi:UDP-GlcNAc:undecaprenyl-phosphate/decaprenyl-phosphate GlcNAc-1-phosphate transferase